MSFERESETYERLKPVLLAFGAEGQHVVIRGETCHAVERTYGEALRVGYERCGLDSFMVRQVWAVEPVHTITRLLTGEARSPTVIDEGHVS